jgi:hypothetical protein
LSSWDAPQTLTKPFSREYSLTSLAFCTLRVRNTTRGLVHTLGSFHSTMEAHARSSSESFHDSDSFLLNDSEDPTISLKNEQVKKRFLWQTIIPWILNAFLLVMLLLETRSLTGMPSGYWSKSEPGLSAFCIDRPVANVYQDFAKREIPIVTRRVKFTGGLTWNSTKQLHRIIEPSIPDYAGIPTPEIDSAWKELISSMSPGT